MNSEENKSSSGTSESERANFRLKLASYVCPSMPRKNEELRLAHHNNVLVTTNLYELIMVDESHKFTLYNVSILPEIAADNFPLKRLIHETIAPKLPKSFKKFFWAGDNLYALITDEGNQVKNNIILDQEVKNIKYKIEIKKLKEIILKKVNNFNGENQKVKSIIENLFRNILMKNPKVIKFQDRTIFEIDIKNIVSVNNQNQGNIYKGFITSAYITESGLYMLINNKNKLITGKTALKKMVEIRRKLQAKNMTNKEIFDEINNYFSFHKTVLTGYGSIKTYKIKTVNFDKSPKNTNILFKDCNGIKKSISIINYYKNQYDIDIKDINQPLLEAENNIKGKNQKLLPSNKSNNTENEEDNKIYLIPSLVYITGIEDDDNQNNRRIKCRNIIDKTKSNPSKKMSAINGIKDLVNSNEHKIIKKNGKQIEEKSPFDLTKEWGINLGNNLTFSGRIIQQPHIFFNHDHLVEPKNGLFRAANPYKMEIITNDNIFFVYDKNEKYEHKKIFNDLMLKFKNKGIGFSNDFHPNKVLGFGLENTNDWDHINNSLRNIKVNKEDSFGIIFCSYQLEKFYDKLKNYFMKQLKIPTQHVITKKIDAPKRGNSIQFNVVDQINIKRGGINYYINFSKEGIIKKGEVFLIIGLDSERKNKKITYSMTSTRSSNLNEFLTQEKIVNDNNQEKNTALKKMFEEAINEINKRSPHCPDYIIIYRQGGNDIRNKILYVSEGDNFTEVLKSYREKYKNKNNFNFKNTKLYYICCNLKSDLKFFETDDKNVAKAYFNPKSGLIVDDNVTQKNKYEFYLQPQYVNQGTATPCHYQIMYYDKDTNEENDLKIEILEKLSFYLCFYFWTWSGSIRLPYLLKMSNTAMTFYKKILDNGESYYYFKKPTYI